MYFAFGWPKTYHTSATSHAVDIKYNNDGTLIAFLSESSLVLWSGDQQRIQLGHAPRTPESLNMSGPNRALCWSPDSSLLAVITSKGYIYFYVLNKENIDPLELVYSNQHQEGHVVSLAGSKRIITISQGTSFLVPHNGAACICGEGECIYIATKDGHLVRMLWTGEIIETLPWSSIPFDQAPPPPTPACSPTIKQDDMDDGEGPLSRATASLMKKFNDTLIPSPEISPRSSAPPFSTPGPPPPPSSFIIAFTYAPIIHTFGVVLSDGTVAILRAKSRATTLEGKLHGRWLPVHSATSVALNAKHLLAAVGCSNGDVKLYQLGAHHHAAHSTAATPSPTGADARAPSPAVGTPTTSTSTSTSTAASATPSQQQSPGLVRVLTLAPWGITPEDTGPVTLLSWTMDERVLAVGWAERGLTLWSIHGCRLMCTIPQLEGFISRSRLSRASTSVELFRDGVTAMAWGPESYHLMVSPRYERVLLQFSLVKSALAANSTLCYSELVILQAEDRLLFLCYKGKEFGDIGWQHLQIPYTYLADNWPVRHISVSRNGAHVAVAGLAINTLSDLIRKSHLI